MRKVLEPNERLIVAIDIDPSNYNGKGDIVSDINRIIESLDGTGVILKFNSVIRFFGYAMIRELSAIVEQGGNKFFADLKLCDIPATLRNDARFLGLDTIAPDFVTVMCNAGQASIKALRDELPDTTVLGVTVLTAIGERESRMIHNATIQTAVQNLAFSASQAGLTGFVCSAQEARLIRDLIPTVTEIITPAIRPAWSIVEGDDQDKSRIMTPEQAMLAGADRIVVGRPITQAKDPREAVLRTYEEIDKAQAALSLV